MKNNLGLHLKKRALLNPDREAVVDVNTGARFSYAEANARCNQVANALTGAGLRPGDRVATLLMNGYQFVETFYGVAKVGGVIVTLNWRLVADELSFILKDSGAETMIFATPFTAICAELHARGTGGTAITRWLHVGAPADTPEWAEHYETALAGASHAEPEIAAADDDLLFIMYTSGTTGLPKGVMHSHSSMLWALITTSATADFRKRDRFVICLPLFHVGALTPLMSMIYLGGTCLIMNQFDAQQIWELFSTEQATGTLAVPAMLQAMLQTLDKETHDYSSLRWVMSGASPVPVNLIETYASMGIEVHQVYGLTEVGGPACLIDPDDAIARAGSTGKAFFHTEVMVVGDNGLEAPVDVPGEVLVKGPNIMVGYWNRPEATADTVVDGWLKTGDIAARDAEGFIYIRDRVKDMIISGGENIYPAEIENVILGVDGVQDTAVIGIPSEKWGESPLAIVVRADETVTEDAILGACQHSLARFKQPVRVEWIDTIPRNPTGKALKRILREQYAAGA
ncbi:long-chain-fatty-acid--CoA ligase [Mycobacterium sp.]|uniref:long-chain-fatty-acid--CoA ligase n=1 Tax=Mycobacterium sp. TaxID=1785 RepID=UPI003BA92658